MFSPIALMALNEIPISDEETPTISEYSEEIPRLTLKSIPYHLSSDPFLSVLDEKNHTITILKKQLQNQKMQLSYYISKELDHRKIEKFSESCTPQASEESLPLNLAINKFCRQAGIKTKLSLLHEHMSQVDYKISNMLRDQEFVLRKIVNKLCEFVKSQESSGYVNFKAAFGNFVTDPLHVDLFDKLLVATIGMSRKLNAFKICCDRVVLIEEERNSIVEQVYSMPVEERINRNYLVGIEMEKAELESEIKRISKHQEASNNRVKELNVMENILHNLQWELNSTYLNNEESCISKMVKKINSEARVLLEMTKEQKRRFECEISKTKCPDSNRILLYIKMAADTDNMDKKEFERCGIKTEEEIRLFEMVKGEVSVIKNKISQAAEQEIKKVQQECEKLKSNITMILLENSRTKVSNEGLKQELEELKLERKKTFQKLREERDAYKSQVEDLQAIREAYAQLVVRQPDTSQLERTFIEQIDVRDKEILDLKNQLLTQNEKLEKLEARNLDQNDAITVLRRFINVTRPSAPRVNEIPKKISDLHTDPCCSKDAPQREKNRSPHLDKRVKKEAETKNQEINVNPHKLRSAIPRKVINVYNKHRAITPASKKKTNKNKNPKSNCTQSSVQSPDQESTGLKIVSQTNDQTIDDQKNIVEAVVTTNKTETIKINENVKVETASVFSMEIKYTNGGTDEERMKYDEFELYKDCSVESFILENRYGKSLKNDKRFT